MLSYLSNFFALEFSIKNLKIQLSNKTGFACELSPFMVIVGYPDIIV